MTSPLRILLLVVIALPAVLFTKRGSAQAVALPPEYAGVAEPLDQLSIRGISFPATNPISGGVTQGTGYTRELVRVQWRSGDPIDLFIVKPDLPAKDGSAKPLPAILYLYSWPSSSDRFYSDAWCRGVTQRGLVAVGFVSALTGERYRNRPWKRWFVSELPESLTTSVHDVQKILNYLATRHDIDSTRIGMFGQGSGGTIALLAASVDPRLRAIDVLDAWGDWPDWFAASPIVPEFQRTELIQPNALQALSNLDPLTTLPHLAASRVRLQLVTPNPSNPPAAVAKMRDAARGLFQVEYATEIEYRERAMNDGAILQWLSDKLNR
ncbi:hypothetical protein HDF16_000258 [Granulicella aggregans]|uniref:Prolyl oligopeptidase family protein n=1 Tax=Granulicella aggregans TaxID=474949 RepID=A0A7W7Z9M7_9BACT|nr:alpha/beta hydrolase [Granulicella aggregans]MBB5055589.1 hypothetical protein [Granulicella aggregans]